MNNIVLASTGAFVGRVNGRNHRLIMQYAPLLHCDGLEFMMYEAWYDKMDQIIADLKDTEILFPVLHTEKLIGEFISRNESDDEKEAIERFKKNCYMAAGLNAKKLVQHLWSGIPSDSNIEHNIETFAILYEIAGSYGLTLTIENIVCNIQDPLTHLKSLNECYPNIQFTFDTRMAAFHNQLELCYEEEWNWLWEKNKTTHLHISDYDGGYKEWSRLNALHIGNGNIDFHKFFQFINNNEYEKTVTVESTSMIKTGEVDIKSLNQSLDFVRLKCNCRKSTVLF